MNKLNIEMDVLVCVLGEIVQRSENPEKLIENVVRRLIYLNCADIRVCELSKKFDAIFKGNSCNPEIKKIYEKFQEKQKNGEIK